MAVLEVRVHSQFLSILRDCLPRLFLGIELMTCIFSVFPEAEILKDNIAQPLKPERASANGYFGVFLFERSQTKSLDGVKLVTCTSAYVILTLPSTFVEATIRRNGINVKILINIPCYLALTSHLNLKGNPLNLSSKHEC